MKKNKTKAVSESDREKWRALLALAYKGELPRLGRLIIQAGYVGDWKRMSASEVGRIFNVSGAAVGKWREIQKCPFNEADRSFNLREVVEWKINRRVEEEIGDRIKDAGGDPNLIGGDSDELERVHKVMADTKEFDLAVKQKKYLKAEQVNEHWRDLGRQIALVIQRLEKRDMETATILRDAVSGFKFDSPMPAPAVENLPATNEQLELPEPEPPDAEPENLPTETTEQKNHPQISQQDAD